MFPTIGLFIHIPKIGAKELEEIFNQLRSLANACSTSAPRFEECWYMTSDSLDEMEVIRFTDEDIGSWNNHFAEKHPSFYCSVFGDITYSLSKKKKGKVVFSAALSPSNRWTVPIEDEERSIRFIIDKTIWDMMDQKRFLYDVQTTCINVGATYACIDYEVIIPHHINHSNYHHFSPDSSKLDSGSYLPGVFWSQFVSCDMIKHTGTVDNIINSLSFEAKRIMSLEGRDNIWIQITEKIDEASIQARLQLRRFFSASLYPLSMESIAKVPLDFNWTPKIEYIPLENFEKEEVERIRQSK
jgi:hypothetical protein